MLSKSIPKGRSDAIIMHLYVKNYMYVNVNYIIKIQLKPERNRCTSTPSPPNTLLRHQPISQIAYNQCCAVKRWDLFPGYKIDPKFNVIVLLHKQKTESPTSLVYTKNEPGWWVQTAYAQCCKILQMFP